MAKQDLAKMAEQVLAEMERPSFIPTTDVGSEHMERDDVKIPQLMIAQAMSPEVNEDDSKYIEGLKVGDFFNGLTGEIFGRGPLTFMIARSDKPRYVEFIPRSEGGGVKDPDVHPDDPRTKFTVGSDGKRVNPVATKFYDYVIVLFIGDRREVMAMSLKSTGLKVARALNGLIKARRAPIYAGVYAASSRQQKNAKGTYYQFEIRQGGWPKTQEILDFMESAYDQFKDKNLNLSREPGDDDDDDISFPHSEGANDEM